MNEVSSSQFPGGTVTFMFSDIEGSTELLKRLRDKYVTLLADQRKIIRGIFNKWNGHEVGTEGDSFFVSFPRATYALNAAVEIQRALAAHTWPDDVEVQIRMGLHTGEPINVTEEGYDGIDVHRAARIAHVGHGGQVLLSETTTALVRDELPDGVSLLELGHHSLKDIDRPERIRQLVIEGLPAEFPPLTSLALTKAPREQRTVGESPSHVLFPSKESPQKASIVVLPFLNMSTDKENEYFSDGLTEEVIADLSKVHDLRVISRTSAMMLKGTTKDTRTIGQDLKVHYLLEGSVRKAGNDLRITAQLIDTLDDAHLWAEKYSGSLEDVFKIQENLSRKIVNALKVELGPEDSRIVGRSPVNPDAHQAYLQGRYHLNMATPEGFQSAIKFFEEAIELENNYALAYAGMATSYNYLGWAGGIAGEVYPKAKRAAVNALEIDGNLPEAHIELGYTAVFYDYDWEAAERHLERAIELNPNSSQAYLHYSWYFFSQQRAEESYAAITRASELDPLSIIIHMNQPNYYHLIGNFEKMLQLSQDTLEIAPFAITALLNAGFAYSELGLFDDASTQFEKVVELTGSGSKGLLGYSYATAGYTDKALMIRDELNNLLEEEYIQPMQIALIFIGLKQFDQAFPWLEKAYEERSSPFIPLIRTMPMFHLIRDEPQYKDLIRRLDFQQLDEP